MLSKKARKPIRHSMLVELHVPDFSRAEQFYQRLGFKKIWERKPDKKKGYLIMKYGQNVLCFWPGNKDVYKQTYFKKFPKHTKRGYGVEIVIMSPELKRVYQRAKRLHAVADRLVKQPWKIWDFRIVDPFGYYLRFTTPHNILSDEYAVK